MAKSKSKSKGLAPVVDMRRPRAADHRKMIAEMVAKGEQPTVAQLNQGMLTAQQVQDEIGVWNDEAGVYEPETSYNAMLEAGKTPNPITPIYDPAFVEAVKNGGYRIAYMGQAKEQPADWPSSLGAWSEGHKIADSIRLCHRRDLRKYVVDPEQNLVTINGETYIIGADDIPAPYVVNASKTGNYGANLIVGKRLSFDNASAADKRTLSVAVARLNKAVEAVKLDDGTKGAVIHYLPYQLASWGHFERDGKAMTYKQIRAAIEKDETKGMKWVADKDAIGGDPISDSQLWQGVKRVMSLAGTKNDEGLTAIDRFAQRQTAEGKQTSDKAWDNLNVQCRNQPFALTCLGHASAQTGVPPVQMRAEDNASIPLIRFVYNVRLGHDWRETKWEAAARIAEEAPEVMEVEAPPEPKKSEKKSKKGDKAKSDKVKSDKVKSKKSAKKDEQPAADEAPPVTEIVETVEPVTEIVETVEATAE